MIELASARVRPEHSSVEAQIIQALPEIARAIETWLFDGASDEDAIKPILAAMADHRALSKQVAELQSRLDAQTTGHQASAREATRLIIERKERAIERDAIVAAGEDLVFALRRYGFPMSEEMWRNVGDTVLVNSQAAIEARTLHWAAVAFANAISGGVPAKAEGRASLADATNKKAPTP